MAKRRPDKQLTQDNYNDEDDIEESGTFQVADKAELASRVIRKAKRRNLSESPTSSPLAGFSGFSKTPAAESSLSFLSKIGQKTNETSSKLTEPTISGFTEKTDGSKKPTSLNELKALNLSFMKWIQQHLDNNPFIVLLPVFRDYEKHLSSMNFGSVAFPNSKVNVTTGVTSDTSFSFNATKKEDVSSPKPEFSMNVTKKEPVSNPIPTFSFNATNNEVVASTKPLFSLPNSALPPAAKPAATSTTAASANLFSSSSQNTLSATAFNSPPVADYNYFSSGASAPAFTTDSSSPSFFKITSVTGSAVNNGTASPVLGGFGGTGSSSGFSFGLPKPSSDAPDGNSNAAAQAPAEGDPTDEPPAFDFVPVGEDGSVFDIRCKVFVKKDQKFSSIGVGTLFLKPAPGGKTQLIVRADTAQGSVLLNLILTADLPLQVTGKNNVLLVCIPTPEANPPPVPVLIRVKTSEERDNLLKEMERLRNS